MFFKIFSDEFSDPRLDNYYLVQGSPTPIITILLAYMGLCKIGPIIMEERKPFQLRSLMTIYNFIQVFGNLFPGLYVKNSHKM